MINRMELVVSILLHVGIKRQVITNPCVGLKATEIHGDFRSYVSWEEKRDWAAVFLTIYLHLT
jgi:hypothetical protein